VVVTLCLIFSGMPLVQWCRLSPEHTIDGLFPGWVDTNVSRQLYVRINPPARWCLAPFTAFEVDLYDFYQSRELTLWLVDTHAFWLLRVFLWSRHVEKKRRMFWPFRQHFLNKPLLFVADCCTWNCASDWAIVHAMNANVELNWIGDVQGENRFIESMCQTILSVDELLWIINHLDIDCNFKKPFLRYFLWVYLKTAGSAVESGAGDLPHDGSVVVQLSPLSILRNPNILSQKCQDWTLYTLKIPHKGNNKHCNGPTL